MITPQVVLVSSRGEALRTEQAIELYCAEITTPSSRGSHQHMQDLRGASVVIAGASSGIGRATALAFARRGARLCLAARR
ncbi:hypothetical protein BS630_15345 [Rhizobium laguerreae]|nr:hypothetical protein BS630_15345 [Rhizobium laguerreae]